MAELLIEARTENLERVLNFVNEQIERADCSPKIVAQVDIAVEEIFVNIACYAYRPEVGPATIRCETGGDPFQIIIGFADHGKPYNPLARQDPDTTLKAEEREIGGLGILLVKKLMDEVKYEFRDGQNILTIKKDLPA